MIHNGENGDTNADARSWQRATRTQGRDAEASRLVDCQSPEPSMAARVTGTQRMNDVVDTHLSVRKDKERRGNLGLRVSYVWQSLRGWQFAITLRFSTFFVLRLDSQMATFVSGNSIW